MSKIPKEERIKSTPCGYCGMRIRKNEYWHDMEHRYSQERGRVVVRASVCTKDGCQRKSPRPFVCPDHKMQSHLAEKIFVPVL